MSPAAVPPVAGGSNAVPVDAVSIHAGWSGADRGGGRRWRLALLGAVCALALVACGGGAASPAPSGQTPGVLAGTAVECSGPAGLPSHPVEVVVSSDGHVVLRQTRLGSHRFRFSLPPGRYRVTTDQSAVVPVTVTIRSGRTADVEVVSSCD
jgi:hypothetical protein